jgi:hypothetical protein
LWWSTQHVGLLDAALDAETIVKLLVELIVDLEIIKIVLRLYYTCRTHRESETSNQLELFDNKFNSKLNFIS